ncbi:MAG: ABC transporter ATP-binding protein [Mycoplasmatales bacterium]|nr:ABC transporter ATP-binding protein [Mycoplasmatales bacterium]
MKKNTTKNTLLKENTTENTLLKIENLNKQYKSLFKSFLALKNINCKFNQGEIWGLIGNNGAGKTTLIKSIIGGLNFEGRITISGYNHDTKEAKKYISYIPEKATFPQGYSVKKYLLEISFLSGENKKEEAIKKIEYYLKYLEIYELINKKPYKLSSGQQKKILLIQALLSNPKLIIMDEPVANLDPSTRYNFFRLLKKINKNKKTSILISSHILAELENFIDGIIILKNGEIVAQRKMKKAEDLVSFYNKKLNIKTKRNNYE